MSASSSPPITPLEINPNTIPHASPHHTNILVLVSHSHTPPLTPTPDLKFDVRRLPNPPKHIRDTHNGTSKRLQEWLLSDPGFVEKREVIREEIRRCMKEVDGRSGDDGSGVGRKVSPVERIEKDKKRKKKGAKADEEDAEDMEEEEEEEEDKREEDKSEEEGNELRVGIFCEMGRHRSVALVELLAKMPWPEEWKVKVEHRDVGRKRGEEKSWSGKGKGKGKGSRGTRGGEIAATFNDDVE